MSRSRTLRRSIAAIALVFGVATMWSGYGAAEAPSSAAAATSGDPVLVSQAGGQPGNGYSERPSISSDGSRVAFASAATNLAAGDNDPQLDVYVAGGAGSPSLASVTADGVPGNGTSRDPSISGDGTKVAFASTATNLRPDDADPGSDIYLKDLSTGALNLVSAAADGSKANGASTMPSLSADGTKVAFMSTATNLDSQDTDPAQDLYVKDLTTGAVTLASVTADGTRANSPVLSGTLAGGGRVAAFSTAASNLSPADSDGVEDVYIKDLNSGTLTLASQTAGGTKGNAASTRPALSMDGSRVAFTSSAGNLNPADTDRSPDFAESAYAKDLGSGQLSLVSGPAGTAGSLSANGTSVAFSDQVAVGGLGGFNGVRDVYVRNLVSGAVSLASPRGGVLGTYDTALSPALSADGSTVAYSTEAVRTDDAYAGDWRGDIYTQNVTGAGGSGARTALARRSTLGDPNARAGSTAATNPTRYVTLLFGRAQRAPAVQSSNGDCTEDTNVVDLQQVAANFDHLYSVGTVQVPLIGVGNVVTDYAEPTTLPSGRFCQAITNKSGATTYVQHANWSDLAALRLHNWEMVSASTSYVKLGSTTGPAPVSASIAQAQTCGSLPALNSHGWNRAWGMFAYPNNVTDGYIQYSSPQVSVQDADVVNCFAYARKYGGPINPKGQPGQNDWFVTTASPLGGASIDYVKPAQVETQLDNFANDNAAEWYVLQFYRFRTGQTPYYNCTGDVATHFTSFNEEYCWNDYVDILTHIPGGYNPAVVTDPATVACAWGRAQQLGKTC